MTSIDSKVAYTNCPFSYSRMMGIRSENIGFLLVLCALAKTKNSKLKSGVRKIQGGNTPVGTEKRGEQYTNHYRNLIITSLQEEAVCS